MIDRARFSSGSWKSVAHSGVSCAVAAAAMTGVSRTAGSPNTGEFGTEQEGLTTAMYAGGFGIGEEFTIETLTGSGGGAIAARMTSRGSAFTPPMEDGKVK